MRTKDEVAKELIERHFDIEPDLITVYRLLAEKDENGENEPIKLLEVNTSTLETGRVVAFGFGPAGAITYSTVVAEISPSELELVHSGEIALPERWSLDRSMKFERRGKVDAA